MVDEVIFTLKGISVVIPSCLLTSLKNMPRNRTGRFCAGWEDSNYALFHSANLCFAVAFLIPHRFQMSVLLMRSVLMAGFLMAVLWSGVEICSPDTLGWNLAFLVTNCGHMLHISYKYLPPRIDSRLNELYRKLFLPLKVTRRDFKELTKEAQILYLAKDEHYAVEGSSNADQRLSILLSGKMKATCEDVLLHYLNPNEFIDSPEWESTFRNDDKYFQVSLSAVEHSTYLCWNREVLQRILNSSPYLQALIHNLIGRDITYKLYSLTELYQIDCQGVAQGSSVEWWQQAMPRSLSVDAVHMGSKGFVRSLLWKALDRRASSPPGDSVESSPARTSRFSTHFSDPGPFRLCRQSIPPPTPPLKTKKGPSAKSNSQMSNPALYICSKYINDQVTAV